MTLLRRILLVCLLARPMAASRAEAQSAPPRASADRSVAELSRLVAGLTTTPRVLVIGMHPDDDDTQLITWLSRAKHVETAYLSITRGEAGLNFGGSESGASLGAIRTQEVLAARRIDGAAQYFTRAFDFGSARNVDDVLKRWNRDSIVGDIVAVIRSFRPQVIVAMLADSVVSGDGQHQALEPFVVDAVASSIDARYPAEPFGIPWLVPRVYRPGKGFVIETDGYDRATGKTYAELAMESRAQHRSQGLRDVTAPKPTQIELRRLTTRSSDSTAADRSLFDGVDTTFISADSCRSGPGSRSWRSPPTRIPRAGCSTSSIRARLFHFSHESSRQRRRFDPRCPGAGIRRRRPHRRSCPQARASPASSTPTPRSTS